MGLFNRKPKEPAGPPQPPSLEGTSPWRLRGGTNILIVTSPEWADAARASTPKVARVGHTVPVELKRDKTGTIWVFHNGNAIGHVDPTAGREYDSAFKALERTKRHGLVDARVEPKEWKSGGAAFIDIAPSRRPCIPFNQPPDGIPLAAFAEVDVKDENKFKDFIQVISRNMNASPGWFVIDRADATGLHPVWAPTAGKTPQQSQVGYVNKAGTKQAATLTADGPVYVPGIVWWRDTTPQIELASWYS